MIIIFINNAITIKITEIEHACLSEKFRTFMIITKAEGEEHSAPRDEHVINT